MPSNDRGSKTVGFGRTFRWSLSARKTAGASSVTRVLFLLTLGTLFSLIGQTSVAPQAHGLYFGTGYNAAVAGNAGGGNQNGVNACATDMVAVGVGLTVNGSSPGFGVYCRAIGSDGQLVASDQSSASNTTAVGGGNNKVFCPAGKVVTGISFIIWSNVAIRCATPPLLSDNSALIWFTATTSTPASTNCSANGIVAGFFTRTGAWTDAIGAYCLPYKLNAVSYNVNGGSGTAPASQTQTTPAQNLTVTSSYTGTRTGFTLAGWNTQANGYGTDYANGSSIRPVGATTLYAKWTSTISYNGNSNTGGSVPNSTTAVSSAASTFLAPNDGSSVNPSDPLVKTGFTFVGWNTRADGAGTSYLASNPPLVTESPYMWFDAANFDDTTNAWTDSSGNSRSIPGTAVTSATAGSIRGNPTKVTFTGVDANGQSVTFPAVQGATTDGIVIGNGALTNYTFCHVARYTGATKDRIFAGTTGNWLSGFWSGATGVAYHEGWITASTGTSDLNWKIQCDTGGSRSSLRSNGVLKSSIANNATGLPANISINLQGSRNAPSGLSDWSVAEFVIYDSVLSEAKIKEIEERLNRKYKVGLFTPSIHTYNYASTGNVTLYAQWNSTITYNGNGLTSASTTVPAPTVAKGTAGNTTLANAGTMVKTGYTFAGWNTQADGLGTNYASGLTTYQSSGDITLYAKWVAVITYDSNGATGAASRSSDTLVNAVSPISMSSLPTVGTMVKAGYTFAGWNTAANGSGTNYSPNLPATYMRFVASNFDDATNVWTDSSGNTRFISGTPVTSSAGNIRGNPTRVAATSGKGATGTFDVVKGMATTGSSTYGDGIIIGNESLPNFTLCYVARYAGSTRGRLFAGVSGNWLSGFYGGYAGVAHPEGWITGLYDAPADDSYRVMCHTGGTASGFRSNGVNRTTVTTNTTVLPANITISSQGSRTAPTERTDWEVAEIVIYPQILNQFQLEVVEDSLKTTYGITNYTTPSTAASQVTFTPTGTTTLYARWIANGYTLAFDTSTATSGTMPSTWVTAGNAFTLPANALTRTGYSFKNWNTAANGSGTTYASGASVTLYAGLTLYPQWNLIAPGVPTVSVSAGNTEVTVTPTPAAASGTTVGPTTSMLVTAFNSSGVALSPAKTCSVIPPATSCVITGLTNGTTYQFAATATNATATSVSSTKVNGLPAGVVVSYRASDNGGIIGTSGTTGTSTATFNKGTPLTLPVASKTGYVFSGWYTGISSGTLIGSAGASFSPPAAITLYARFVGIVYTINYNGNGNTGGTVPANAAYETGSNDYNNTEVFKYTGADQSFRVPNDISGTKEILVEVWGAGGGGTNAWWSGEHGGGAGGYSKVRIATTTAGEELKIVVGQGGQTRDTTPQYGGGGAGGPGDASRGLTGSSGGGYSGIFSGNTPLVISGGGGGASPGGGDTGGGGGHGQSGTAGDSASASGRGGTTSGGGAGATSHSCATAGSSLTGGAGCGVASSGTEGGGGGGGGYFGGGGGSYQLNTNPNENGGGGGGSGFLGSRSTQVENPIQGGRGVGNNFSYPGATNSSFYGDNAGRGGKGYSTVESDYTGGNGRIVIRWKTGTGAHIVGAGPTKVGYTFAGWTTNADGTGTTYQPNDSLTPSTNVSLFAKWTANTNTITYNANSGTGSVPSSGSYVSGAATPYTVLSKPNDLTKTGSEFIGWNTAANGTGTGYSAGASLTTVENVILYAQWRESTYSYSYQLNGGTSAQPASGTAIYNASITLPAAPTRTGFTFAGWNDGTNTISLSTTSVNITANRIFVAQWTAQSFTISFDGNNAFGGVNTSGSMANGSFVAGGVPYSIAANGFTKPGYNFDGWKNAGGTSFVVGSGYSTAANLTLIAQWTPASYTITYNANGATSGTAPSAGTLTTGTAFTAAVNPSPSLLAKTGYTFSGWNTAANGSGTNYAEGAAVTTTSNLTLFAKWTIISPTITFDRGIATSSTLPPNTSAQYGSLYTIPISDTSTVISGTNAGNYAFTGWADSSNNIYQPGSTYRMGTSNVTFTAQWVAVYTVRYVLNGGLVNGSTGALPSDTLRTSGFGETLTATVPIRAGHSFSGWKDQSGVTISATGGGWTISDSSYIAYAQWTQTPRTLSFSANSGTGTQSSITGKFIGELVPLPEPTLTRDGYTFSGWSDGTNTYPAGGSFTVGNSDQAFTAVWVGNSNTIFYNGNGATGGTAPSNGSQVTGAAYTVASNASSPNPLVKTGFTFAGWNTNANGTGTDYAVGATGLATTSNVTLFAKWTAASFAVTYVTGVGASAAPTQADTMYGSSFTLPTAPTQTGFNFLGWETGSGADATLFAPGSSYTMGSSAVTFTAKWSGLSYVVVYLLNGGSGTTPTQPDVTHGQNFTTATAPTRNGFTFSGWSDGATVINASTSVTNVTSNKTLTAQWAIAAPGIPGTPTATPGNGSATITIVAPTTGGTPSSYTVTASPTGATCTVTAPGTSCTIAPLDNGTAYTFTSTATNTAGNSTSASAASTAVTPAGVPLSPSSISGTGLGGSTTIEWIAPTSDGGSPITDYVIEYSVAGSGTWTTFSDGTSTATSATITGLTAGNAYEFRVSAKNLIGNSLPSFTSPVVESLPTAPAITAVTGGSEKVTVTWNAPSHLGSGTLTDYEVTAYDAAGNVAGTCNPASGQRTCDVTGLDNGSSYTFKVAAITSIGSSAQSSASSVVIPAGVPSAPANVAAVTSGSNMTVTFDAPSDTGGSAITSYVVTSSPSGATCTRGANATTYTCTGLTAGTNYTYSVKAVNSKGESSASLDSTAVTAVAAPSAPLNVSAVITAGTTTLSAIVSFDPPASENGSPVTSYTVTASPGGATCTVTAPTTYCEIPVLPDRVYTFTVTATNAVGTSVASSASLETKAANGIAPTLVVDPIPAPTGDLAENKVLSSNITFADFNSTPNSVVTYQWKRCTDPLDDTTCTSISGATSTTYTLGSSDVDKYIRVEITATNSIGTLTKLSDATEIIVAAPVSTPSTPSTPAPSVPAVDPAPVAPSCDASCQAIRDAAATKAAADAAAKAAADKAAADAAAKLKADADARSASDKASAAAKAAADAAKAAVEKAGAAAAAKAAADAAAAAAAAQAKAAADAQAAANKAAAAAQAALKNSAASAAAKAAATASANKAAAEAAAAVKAAASAAQNAAKAKTAVANANKQVEIAINSLSSKTASAKATAEANAIAAAAKTAANEAAAAAAAKAGVAKATASAAQKAAADAAARISTEQKEAAAAAAAAKAAADAAAKASAEKIAATNVAKVATENLVKVLNEKATLAEEAAKATDSAVREEIAKKIDEIETKLDEVEAAADAAADAAEEAITEFEEAQRAATEAQSVAVEEAQDAVEIKTEAATKTAAATKAVANASVAAKVATAAKAAAAKVPSKAVINKPATSTNKNSAKATVTGLKPGQKVKVTVNVKPKP